MNGASDPVFRRAPGPPPPRAVGGAGPEIVDADGRRWLDATSGVFVTALGVDPPGVADAIAAQMRRLPFAYGGHFSNAAEDALAEKLIARAPAGFGRVWLTTSGAAANETAVKLARQHHLLKGAPDKAIVLSRRHSYHGATLGALALTGHAPRRAPYAPFLPPAPRLAPPDCARCPFGLTRPGCGLACADDLDAAIRALGPERVSAVIVETVAGAPLGALVSPADYLARLRAICDRRDVLLIADEVVTGVGRAGRWFASDLLGATPDIITLGKGLGAGFTPIGAVLASERALAPFADRGAAFTHSESFSGHPVMAAAGAAVIDVIERRGLLARVRAAGDRLGAALAPLASHQLVAEVRGAGLLRGVALAAGGDARTPFPRALGVAEAVVAEARRGGVLLLAGAAGADGADGDAVVLAPAFVSTDAQIDRAAAALAAALDRMAARIG